MLRTLTILFPLVMTASTLSAQDYTNDDVARGYVVAGSDVTFLFDESFYGLATSPNRVVVTGSFAGWSQDMEDVSRTLNRDSGNVWTLTIDNAEYGVIPPSAEFKYRIDHGEWLSPPSASLDVAAGNHVFMAGIAPLRIRAKLLSSSAVWLSFSGDDFHRPLDPASYTLTDGRGRQISISHVSPNTASETLLVPGEKLDIRRVYYVEVAGYPIRALCRRDEWFKSLYSDKLLGAEPDSTNGKTSFRLFSPRAERIRLFLYDGPFDSVDDALDIIEMIPDQDGVWETLVDRDLAGVYYDFTVHGPPDPGNFFYDSHPVHISDPYSRANVDAFGKSRVMYPTKPARALPNGRPAIEDLVAYEVHIQDFTDRLPVSEELQGTLPAMYQKGLTNSRGASIGFDHLIELGINAVHLMPVQEYLHYPNDEWQAAFAEDPYMIRHGINMENYQWGYRTTHAFAIENRYRAKNTDFGAEREQFRDLVQAFHDEGIAVVIDLVPNHTGENMDGRNYLFNFNVLDKALYYRTDENLQHIGPFGNEVKTEDRPMVQRWLIDQCVHLINEFGIDGFRIDLAGQIDEQSLLALRAAVGDDVIIYGEPWIAPTDPDVQANPDWAWYKVDAPITYFQDGARNAFKGPVSDPTDPIVDRGFAGGDGSVRSATMMGLANTFEDEREPYRGINYLDIHDNWALADRFGTSDWNGGLGVEEARFKLAATLLYTSLGPLVLHGGTELMRSKGHAPVNEVSKSLPSGELAYHGMKDSYNLRTANQFVWENKGRNLSDGSPNDYDNMFKYWRGLNALRSSDAGAALRVADRQAEDYYRWILPDDTRLLGYTIGERILVLMNTTEQDATFRLPVLPDGEWMLVGNGDTIDISNGVDAPYSEISSGRSVTIPKTVAAIWVKQ